MRTLAKLPKSLFADINNSGEFTYCILVNGTYFEYQSKSVTMLPFLLYMWKIHTWISHLRTRMSKPSITYEFIAEHILPELRGSTIVFVALHSRCRHKWGTRHIETRHTSHWKLRGSVRFSNDNITLGLPDFFMQFYSSPFNIKNKTEHWSL